MFIAYILSKWFSRLKTNALSCKIIVIVFDNDNFIYLWISFEYFFYKLKGYRFPSLEVHFIWNYIGLHNFNYFQGREATKLPFWTFFALNKSFSVIKFTEDDNHVSKGSATDFDCIESYWEILSCFTPAQWLIIWNFSERGPPSKPSSIVLLRH